LLPTFLKELFNYPKLYAIYGDVIPLIMAAIIPIIIRIIYFEFANLNNEKKLTDYNIYYLSFTAFYF